jgi:hypothetical protein
MSRTTTAAGTSCGGCLSIFVLMGLIGGWFLQYDLNMWAPILHRMSPETFSNPGPFHMSFLMWVAGFFLGESAIPVAIVTWLLFGLGVIH